MLDFIVDNFSAWFTVVVVAMIPLLESKVAIPLGMSFQIWGAQTLSPFVSFLLALLGSMIPAVFVIMFARFLRRKTSGFLYDKFVTKIEGKYKANLEKINQKNTTFKRCALLAMFVAVPLPLTGVYSGSLIAGFTNLKLWQSMLSIFVGAVISCLIVLLMSTVIENSAFVVLLISLMIIVVFVMVNALVYLFGRIKKEKR